MPLRLISWTIPAGVQATKPLLVFLAELADVEGVEAVDVFAWEDTVEGGGFVDVLAAAALE